MSAFQALLVKLAEQRGEPANTALARVMYERHRVSAPAWDSMSDGFQKWMIEQADVVIAELSSCETEESYDATF